MVNRTLFLFIIFMIYSGSAAFGRLRVLGLFADNMVIQREEPIVIQGTALPQEAIRVTFHESIVLCHTDANGTWKLELPAAKAGGPYVLTIQTAREVLSFENVLVGDIWLASGQSNMEHPMEGWKWLPHSSIYRYKEEISDSDYPDIRLFSVPKYPAAVEIEDVPEKRWEIANPQTIRTFSSTAWFFAKELHKRLRIPIGIINCSWAGTSILTWESKEVLNQFKDSLNDIRPSTIPDRDKVMKAFMSNQQRKCQISIPRDGQVQEIHELPHSAWETIELNNMRSSLPNVIWLRKEIDIPETYAKESLTLSLGVLNRQSILFFNGKEIGEFMYPKPAITRVPRSCICPGKNELLIRLAQPFGAPSVKGDKSCFFISTRDTAYKTELTGKWELTIADHIPQPQPEYQNNLGALFNGMIHPCLNHNIKGIIWYQGENDVWKPDLYADMFKSLITDWRNKWRKKEMPFLYVQISLIPGPEMFGDESVQQTFRKKQQISLANTGMVYSLDIGDPYDVHPRNKKVIGERLAEQAFRTAYK